MGTRALTPEEMEGPGFLGGIVDFGKGIVEGVKLDPFVALALKGLNEIEGRDPEGIKKIAGFAKESTPEQFGKFIGEFAPTLLLGIPLLGAGAAAGRVGIQAVAGKLFTQQAAKKALQAAGRAGTRLPRVQEQAALIVTRKASDSAAKEALVQGLPGAQRVAQATGANLAFTQLIVSQELARGKPLGEALETGAISAAIFTTFDLALVGTARALFPGARSRDLIFHKEAFLRENAANKGVSALKVKQAEAEGFKTSRREMADNLWDTIGGDAQQLELFQARLSKTQRLRAALKPPIEEASRPTTKVFHGTKSGGEIRQQGFRAGPGGDVEGIFFSESQQTARLFGGGAKGSGKLEALPAQIELRNPASFDDIAAAKTALGPNWTPKSLTKRLKDEGFDGVIDDSFIGNELIVFDPKQVLTLGATVTKAVAGTQAKVKKTVIDLLGKRKLERSKLRQVLSEIKEEGTHPYIGRGPAHAGPIQKLWNRFDPAGEFRFGLTTAAESKFGAFGSAGNRGMTPMARAVQALGITERSSEEAFVMWSEKARKLLGEKSQNVWKNGVGKQHDSWHAWETGGRNELQRYMKGIERSNKDFEEMAAVFEAHEKLQKTAHTEALQIGAKPAINPQDFNLERYISHPTASISEADMANRLVKKGFSETEAYEILSRLPEVIDDIPPGGAFGSRPGLVSALDFYRTRSGSYKQKFEEGMPMNPNIWDAQWRVYNGIQRRIHIDPILGRRVFNPKTGKVEGDRIPELVASVEAEGQNGPQFRTMLNTMAGRSYYNESMKKLATFTTSIQVASKLSVAVFENSTQPILNATWGGVRPAFKALVQLTNKETRENVARTVALQEHIMRGIGRSADSEGLTLVASEKMADWTLRVSQFNRVERGNRLHGSQTAQVVIRDTLAKGFRDKLKGVNLDLGRRRLGELGLDLQRLVTEMKDIGPEAFFKSPAYLKLEQTAMVTGAQKTQFFPGPGRTPSWWHHPIARVMLQFKTFAVGQSRFLRDVVISEYSHGNVAPMATWLGLAPIAGEAVGNIKAIINDKGRGDHGIARGLDNYSYVGGAGFFGSMWIQARYGDFVGGFLGPTAADFNKVTQSVMSGSGQGLLNLVQKQPFWKATSFLVGAGVNTVEEIDEYLDSSGDLDGSSTTRVEVGDKIIERARQKRQP